MGCAHAKAPREKGLPAPSTPSKGDQSASTSQPSAGEKTVTDDVPKAESKIKAPSSARRDQVVLDLLHRYKTQVPVSVKIRKRVISPYLAKEKMAEGELQWSKKLFRLDLSAPENSTMVVDDRNIWLENRLEKELGGQVQVSKFSLNETRRANAIFAVLFDDNNFLQGFTLKDQAAEPSGVAVYTYLPKKKADDYTELSISIMPKEQKLVRFSYRDDLENQVIYDFGQTQFKANVKQWQLEYTPPRGVKINEF